GAARPRVPGPARAAADAPATAARPGAGCAVLPSVRRRPCSFRFPARRLRVGQGIQAGLQARGEGAVHAHALAVQAQLAARQAGVGGQAHAAEAGQVRCQHAQVVGMKAQLDLARGAADRVQRLAHQVGEKGRVGLVGAPEQGAGDAHRQVAQGVRDLALEPGQRAGEAVQDPPHLGDRAAHLGLAGGQALGVAGLVAVAVALLAGGLFQRLQFLDAGRLRDRFRLRLVLRGGWLERGRLQVRRGPAHDLQVRGGGRAHTKASCLAASWMVPASAMRRTSARISFCAASTSARRTGPRASMSSSRICAARWDMLAVIFSRTPASAPRRAIASLSLGISRSTAWIARSSRSARLSKTNIRSRMRAPSGSSMRLMLVRISSSWPESMKLRMLAAIRTPPIVEDFRFWLPENWRAITSLSSLSALGGMPSRVAMRSSTSARTRSARHLSTSAAWSSSRWAMTMAMICGCSLRTSSAIARGSIHFRVSRPEVLRPARMRSISPLARSSPKAWVSTARM